LEPDVLSMQKEFCKPRDFIKICEILETFYACETNTVLQYRGEISHLGDMYCPEIDPPGVPVYPMKTFKEAIRKNFS